MISASAAKTVPGSALSPPGRDVSAMLCLVSCGVGGLSAIPSPIDCRRPTPALHAIWSGCDSCNGVGQRALPAGQLVADEHPLNIRSTRISTVTYRGALAAAGFVTSPTTRFPLGAGGKEV